MAIGVSLMAVENSADQAVFSDLIGLLRAFYGGVLRLLGRYGSIVCCARD